MFILFILMTTNTTNSTTTEEAMNRLSEDVKIIIYSVFGTTGGSIIIGLILKCFGCCSCKSANVEHDKTFHI